MSTKTVVRRLALTKARINLGAVVRRVHLKKEYVILEKDGIPIVGIMDVDEMEDYLELQDKQLQQQIKEGYEAYRQGKTGDARKFLEELKQEMNPKKSSKVVSP